MLRRDPLAQPEALIRRVYAYVAYRIGDGADAEDVTSATIERAVRYRDSYHDQKGDPAAWVIGIARRCIAEHFGTGPETVELTEVAGDADLEHDAVRRLALRAAMAELSDEEQELLALRYGADLSAKQIAVMLHLRTNAVEVRLHRTIRRLRAVMDEGGSTRAGRRAAPQVSP